MPLGLLGIKIGMTQVYDDKGSIAPVTVLQCGPCPVLQVREPERDGYHAVQLGFVDKPRRKAQREAGVALLPKANVEPQRHVREFRMDGEEVAVKVGDKLVAAEVFKDIPRVDVIGTSKGRGTTGVIKRHNFGGLRHSHGFKKGSRQRGSISSNASNRGSGRPKKGIRMAGQYGNERATIRNLQVVRIDPERNLLLVKGAVPGYNGALVMVRPTNKRG